MLLRFTNAAARVHNRVMEEQEYDKTEPETADADGYYGEDDADMDDMDLSFLDDEDAEGQEKHSA